MSDELNELQSITHEYRKSLAAYEARTGRAPQSVDTRGSGEEREKFAKMDADLTSAELIAQNKALESRLAKLESQPTLEPRASFRSPDQAMEANYRWCKAVCTGDATELRVLTKGSTTNAPVPTDMERMIIKRMYQASVLRQISNVQTINSNRTITVEASLPAANFVAEEGGVTAADPTFDAVSVVPRKVVAANTMSQEFIDDAIGSSDIGSVVNWVTERFAIALARRCDQAYTVGNTGATVPEPQGIGATNSTAWASTNSGRIINQGVALTEDQTVADITADNIIDCVHAVPPQYRTSPRFRILTSDSGIRAFRKLKLNNEYIWLPQGFAANGNALTAPAPGTIYGIPYNIGEYVPSTAAQTSTGANVRGSALFIVGDFNYFGIFDRVGLNTMMDPYSGAANMRTTVYMWLRTDSKILLPQAFAAIYAPNAS